MEQPSFFQSRSTIITVIVFLSPWKGRLRDDPLLVTARCSLWLESSHTPPSIYSVYWDVTLRNSNSHLQWSCYTSHFFSLFYFSIFILLHFYFCFFPFSLIFSASSSLISMMGVGVTLDTFLKPEMKDKWSVVCYQLSNGHYPTYSWWVSFWTISSNASG